VAAVQVVVLLVMAPFYGPHRDELYFVSAGQHLAWGYPDQPSFTPLLAGLAHVLAPGSLVVLRLPSILAVVGLALLTAQFARLLGGGRAAQTLASATVAVSALTITVGHRLSTATFDTLAWTAVLVLVTQALLDERPRLWLLAGAVAGIGLNNKHAVVFVLLGVLVGVALTRETRHALRTRWPWLGGLVALGLWTPNLLWQAAHDWPALALSADIAEEYGGLPGRLEMVGQALVMFSPLVSVVAGVGTVALLRRPEWRPARPVAVALLAVAVVFLVTGGKGYYLAGLVPPLVAAGCVVLGERRPPRRLVRTGTVLALSALVAWPALVPVLPAATYAASPYPAIDQDQLETIGWPEYAATVRSVAEGLPAATRRTAVVFTGNYGEAGALEWYDVGLPVYSGHNGWREWGPPPADASPVVVLGLMDPSVGFSGCEPAATLHNDAGADNGEEGRTVWLCEAVRGSWADRWSELVHYDA
jgi:hypothetical protein